MISLFKNDLKQLKNVIVIFCGLMLLCLAINLVSYQANIPIMAFYLIALVYSLTIPVVNLHYLFDRVQQTHFASLPFTKLQSFIIHYLSGLFCILVPVFIYCIIEAFLGRGIVIENCLALFLMIWIYYSLGNLAAYLTTTVFVDLILQVVVIIAPIAMYICLWMVYQAFVRGITATELSPDVIGLLIPLFKLFICGNEGISSYYILLYFSYGLVIFVLALCSCLKRNCDTNYHGYTFKLVSQVIKLVIIIALSWIVTSLFDFSGQTLKVFIVINVIVTFVVTFVVQFIYLKKLKYIFCTVQATLIVLASVTIFGTTKDYLENYIPRNVETAVITSPALRSESKSTRIKDQTSIDRIIDLHQSILDQKNINGDFKILITYYQSNGETTSRLYSVNSDYYQEVLSNFTPSMTKSWLGSYYDNLNEIDKVDGIEYYFDNGYYMIIDHSDRVLFKNLLQEQLTKFENDPSLIEKIIEVQEISYTTTYKNNNLSYNVYKNTPLALAIEKYHKIKVNSEINYS